MYRGYKKKKKKKGYFFLFELLLITHRMLCGLFKPF